MVAYYLPFIDKSLESSEDKVHKVFLDLAKIYREKLEKINFKFERNTNYVELQHLLYTEGRDGLVEEKELSYAVWIYLLCRLVESDIEDIEIWKSFAKNMNLYVEEEKTFPFSLFQKEEKEAFPFQVSELVSYSGIFHDISSWQEFIVSLLECNGFINFVVSENLTVSFRKILNRLDAFPALSYELWIRVAKVLGSMREKKIDGILKKPRTIRILDNMLLADSEFKLETLRTLLDGLIERIQDGGSNRYIREHSSSTIAGFLSVANEEIAEIFNSNFDPSSFNKPKSEFAMNLMLIGNISKSSKYYNYHNGLHNYHSIYLGAVDDDFELHWDFRAELVKDLFPIAVAGFTETVKRNNLKFIL